VEDRGKRKKKRERERSPGIIRGDDVATGRISLPLWHAVTMVVQQKAQEVRRMNRLPFFYSLPSAPWIPTILERRGGDITHKRNPIFSLNHG